MSVRIIYGPSGSGKTHKIYKNIIERSVACPDKKYIIIVPEQSSLQAQKRVVRMHPAHGTFNIDVLTFGRLAIRIFDELGIELNETIDDTGKNLIVRKVINDLKEDLNVLKPNRKQGYISEIKSMISELKQYGVSPENLEDIIENTQNDRLRDKLRDVYRIYKGFNEYIKDRFITVEDKPELLSGVIDKASFISDAVILFDGFTGFTPIQYKIIEKMIKKAENIIFTATISDDTSYNSIKGSEELFFMSKDMIKKLGDIADRLNMDFKVERQCYNPQLSRFRSSDELMHIEQNIFRYNRNAYKKDIHDIRILKLPLFSDEVQFSAATVLKDIQSGGYRFRDFALITGDMETYGDEIQKIFNESGIPFFMDAKRSILGNPLVEYIRAMLEMTASNYSYESVFRVLKNGLCDIDRDDVDYFENYIIAMGIRGENRYHEKFVRRYDGQCTELEEINRVREAFTDKTDDFAKSVMHGDKPVSEYVEAIYRFMEQEKLYERMNELANEVKEESRAEEFGKCYENIIQLLDRIYELLGDEIITIREFRDILDAGFEEIKLGLIPPSGDCVMVGDFERTRLEDVKVLIVLGANEGMIPKPEDNHGVLTEEDRKILADSDVVLSPLARDKVFIQNFYMYLSFTRPEKKLYITCHAYGTDGKETEKSRVISIFQDMFEKLEIENTGDLNVTDFLTNKKNSMHLLMDSERYNKGRKGYRELAKVMSRDSMYAEGINRYIGLVNDIYMDNSISRKAMEMIYEDFKESSISRIETYASCAFRHFAEFALKLTARKEYTLNNMDIGILFHRVLELVGNELKENGITYSDLSDEERNIITEAMIEKASLDYGNSFFNDSEINAYLKKRLTKMVERTLWALGEQLKAGIFTPYLYEKKFNNTYEGLKITGKVDRIDRVVRDDTTYVKIIDYKSGDKKIIKEDILAGTNIQLFVYMKNILDEMEKQGIKAEPSAVLYNKIHDPIAKENDNPLKAFRPEGIIGYDSIDMLDNNITGESMVIPVKLNKDGNLAGNETVVTSEQFRLMADYSSDKMISMVKEIKAGEVKANPYEKSCDYCIYNGVCGFNKVRNDEFRKKPDADKEKFWKTVGKETEINGVDQGTGSGSK